jgi:hypothetical protein
MKEQASMRPDLGFASVSRPLRDQVLGEHHAPEASLIWFPVSLTLEFGRPQAAMAIATDATMPLLDTTGALMLS